MPKAIKICRNILMALPFLFGLYLFKGHPWQTYLPLVLYALMSALTFSFYGLDKRSAKKGTWRTPELHLHILEVLGGWPGALLAQQVFRHKTKKVSFKIWLWLSILLHFIAWAAIFYFDFKDPSS